MVRFLTAWSGITRDGLDGHRCITGEKYENGFETMDEPSFS